MFQMAEFGDHRGPDRNPVGQRTPGSSGAFLGGAQPDEEGEEDQHEFTLQQAVQSQAERDHTPHPRRDASRLVLGTQER
jgi:hypothetical protein